MLHLFNLNILLLSQAETAELREGFAGLREQSQETGGTEAWRGRLCALPGRASFRHAS